MFSLDHKRLTVVTEHTPRGCAHLCECVCVSDQEGGRWRSVCPEWVLRGWGCTHEVWGGESGVWLWLWLGTGWWKLVLVSVNLKAKTRVRDREREGERWGGRERDKLECKCTSLVCIVIHIQLWWIEVFVCVFRQIRFFFYFMFFSC